MFFQIAETLFVFLICMLSSIAFVQAFQTQRYQLNRYTQYLGDNAVLCLRRYLPIGLVSALVKRYLPVLLALFIPVETIRASMSGWLVLLAYIIIASALAARDIVRLRTHFRLTMRVRRLLVAHAIVYAAFTGLILLLRISPYLLYLTVPVVTWIAGRIMKPIEDKINRGFYLEAKQKIRRRKDLICIGITGSAGKTQTKFILKEILSAKYDVLMTPASYNTPMGVSQTINDLLEDEHQVFIAEMGAQYKGDIRTLCNLVHPQYGIITSIGQQHIDTLGSVESVMKTKEELVRTLPEDGEAFFASDSGYLDMMYNNCTKTKFRIGVNQSKGYYMYATEMSFTDVGSVFWLNTEDGKRSLCRTQLLGRFNVQAITLSAAVAARMGFTLSEITEAIASLTPQEHKLQLSHGACLEIDDTLNTSREGVADALNVLMAFPNRRIVVTSGYRFSNKRNSTLDYEFGYQIQESADLLILVGDEEDLFEIIHGATDGKMKRQSMKICKDFESVQRVIGRIRKKTDIILYEGPLE